MSMPAVRAGDVVRLPQGFADPHGNRLFANVKVRQSRHQRARVQLIHLPFKLTNHHHASIYAHPLLRLHILTHSRLVRGRGHWEAPDTFVGNPDICAKTSNTTAKSFSTNPIPRAAVKNSFVTAVVGIGTSSCLPNSSASSMSFCIMFTLNQASSGIFNTNGPRYCTIGDAITLCVSTSTAVSRLIPLFSASNTPSQNASICTARLRFVAIFIESAFPLSPT